MRVPERRVPPATGLEDPATTVCDAATPPQPLTKRSTSLGFPLALESPALRRSEYMKSTKRERGSLVARKLICATESLEADRVCICNAPRLTSGPSLPPVLNAKLKLVGSAFRVSSARWILFHFISPACYPVFRKRCLWKTEMEKVGELYARVVAREVC